jgi:hypothetical protein
LFNLDFCMFANILKFTDLDKTFEAAMDDPAQGNATYEVFTDPDLEIFTLNDLCNVITYTVMSLGEFLSSHQSFTIRSLDLFDAFLGLKLHLLGP